MTGSILTREEREEQRRRRAEREAALRLKNNKLGITIFQGSWIMVFVCLVLVYWQMGFNPGWRPSAAQRPEMLLPTLATVALLASTWCARSALQQVRAGQVAAFQAQWRIAIATGVVFFAIMLQQFTALPPADSLGQQYGQIFRVMIGYHAAHALAIGLMMIQVYRYSLAGRYHAGNSWSVEATVRLWYFVTAAWVLFYVVLYLI
ncbi:MAG: cytochrome c oxidase subunit 3 [Anaerolineae bacterium]|jgi:heme/copper-type cytochrome/quinol oxidase subunit 3|nr:cytochrome c oxidase subunit 3 [Anaerolineae bacterium]